MEPPRNVAELVAVLERRGARREPRPRGAVAPASGRAPGRDVVVVLDGDVAALSRALVGEAAAWAQRHGGRLVAFGLPVGDDAARAELGSWGVDVLVVPAPRAGVSVAGALAQWCAEHEPRAVFAPATAFGAGLAAGVAAELGTNGGILPNTSPLFSSHPAIRVLSAAPIPVVTVRAGFVGTRTPRAAVAPELEVSPAGEPQPRFVPALVDPRFAARADAPVVIGVGVGVDPDDYPVITAGAEALGAVVCATRKVTDRGWLPRDCHVGSSGRVIAPRLYLLLGASGHAHHRVGIEAAGTICAFNRDPYAPVWDFADTGLVGGWREHFDELVPALAPRPVTL